MTVTILTASDRAAAGTYSDRSGPRIEELLRAAYPDAEVRRVLVRDETEEIEAAIKKELATGSDWIITTGGTGIGPRDRTVDATRRLLDRELPGIAEAIRAESLRETPMAVLSRGTAGMAGSSFIVNLPGSVGAVETGMRVLAPIMAHALSMRSGEGH